MAKRNNIAVAALVGIIAGVLMGAGTVQYAEVLAYSGANPNFAKDIENFRSIDGAYYNKRALNYDLGVRFRDDVEGEDVDQSVHSSAGAYTRNELPRHCVGLSRTRLNRCIAAYEENLYYQTSDFIPY